MGCLSLSPAVFALTSYAVPKPGFDLDRTQNLEPLNREPCLWGRSPKGDLSRRSPEGEDGSPKPGTPQPHSEIAVLWARCNSKSVFALTTNGFTV